MNMYNTGLAKINVINRDVAQSTRDKDMASDLGRFSEVNEWQQ